MRRFRLTETRHLERQQQIDEARLKGCLAEIGNRMAPGTHVAPARIFLGGKVRAAGHWANRIDAAGTVLEEVARRFKGGGTVLADLVFLEALRLFDVGNATRPALFAPGDVVRFTPIDHGEFERLAEAVATGEIDPLKWQAK